MAQALAARVDREAELQRLAPVALNIVCFRYLADDAPTDLSAEIVADLQEAGIAAPSTTVVCGRLAIRAAIVNHRTRVADVDAMIDAVLAAGRARAVGRSMSAAGCNDIRSAASAPSSPRPGTGPAPSR